MNLTPVMQDTHSTTASAQPGGAGEASPLRQVRPGLVAFVGTGPGDSSLLTLRAAELLGQADLVVSGPELTRRLAHLLPSEVAVTEVAEAPADASALIAAAQAGQLVVRLCPGDPLLFGHAAAEAEACA